MENGEDKVNIENLGLLQSEFEESNNSLTKLKTELNNLLEQSNELQIQENSLSSKINHAKTSMENYKSKSMIYFTEKLPELDWQHTKTSILLENEKFSINFQKTKMKLHTEQVHNYTNQHSTVSNVPPKENFISNQASKNHKQEKTITPTYEKKTEHYHSNRVSGGTQIAILQRELKMSEAKRIEIIQAYNKLLNNIKIMESINI